MTKQNSYNQSRSPQQENSPDLVRWMIEIDDFVRQVSAELSAISIDLGQASDVPDLRESRERENPSPLDSDEVPLNGTARLQAIRDRLTRMTNPASESEPARYSREQG